MRPAPTAYCQAEGDLIRQLWTQGKSAREISAAIHERFRRQRSRNAVIGWVHRNGLQPREVPSRAIPTPRKRVKIKQRAPVAAKTVSPATSEAKTAERPPAATRARFSEPAPPPLNLDIMQVTDQTCRYPVTDDRPHLFCGHPVEPGRSWCAAHAARVFQSRED